jgi:hypothetical protein
LVGASAVSSSQSLDYPSTGYRRDFDGEGAGELDRRHETHGPFLTDSLVALRHGLQERQQEAAAVTRFLLRQVDQLLASFGVAIQLGFIAVAGSRFSPRKFAPAPRLIYLQPAKFSTSARTAFLAYPVHRIVPMPLTSSSAFLGNSCDGCNKRR